MPERLGPRFAIEAVFLVVLAVVAVLADLPLALIALCMGAAWLLAAIYEYARWRQGPRLPVHVRAGSSRRSAAPVPVDGPTRVVGLDADDEPFAAEGGG